MLDVIVRGGQAVTLDGVGLWDLAIQGEKIVALAVPDTLTAEGAQVIDASGMLVLPGGIDPHVHTQWPMRRPNGDVFLSAPPLQVSRAALYGGTTTLVDYAAWDPALSLAECLRRWEEPWRESYTDYSFHMLLRGEGAGAPEVLAQIPETISAGFPSFKVFMTDTFPSRKGRLMTSLGNIWAIMQRVARHGGILAVHAEDDDLVMHMYERLQREGRTGYENIPLVHSTLSEEISTRRIINLARHVEGAALYLVHVSAGAAVDAIAEARADGYPVYGETLHHFATFTADVYSQPDGLIYHTYPSLKYEEDRLRLWSGLKDGSLSTVGTDECSTVRALKLEARSILDAFGGHVGVETRLPIVYTEGVSKRGLSLERFVAITSTNPARILGLYPQKGVLAPGSDADVVIFDPSVRKTLRSEELHGSDYSAWDGWEVHGWPSLVMLRGKVVVDNSHLLGRPGDGERVFARLHSAIQAGPCL